MYPNYISHYDDLLLTNYEWRIERIDVAIDTVADYDELYKVNCYLKELFAIKINCDNAYRVIGDDMRKRSTVVKSERFELEIYNKHLESGDPTLPQTRCEFRYKRLYRRKTNGWEKVIVQAIEDTKKTLQQTSNYISRLDQIKERVLLEAYHRENLPNREGRTPNLSTFIIKYSDYIYTRTNLKALYVEEINGDFNSWVYRFKKKGNVLKLIKPKVLKQYCNELNKSLSAYLKNCEKSNF